MNTTAAVQDLAEIIAPYLPAAIAQYGSLEAAMDKLVAMAAAGWIK